MELKIINKNADPLLARTKVETEIIFEKGTPTRAEIKSKLGKDLGKDEKLIVVKGIYTRYGLKKATNLSYVYENEDALKRIEVGKKETKSEEKGAEKSEDKKEVKQEQKKDQPKHKEVKGEVKQEIKKPEEQSKDKK